MKYDWKYGENRIQRYYEVRIGNEYLCVFADKSQPDIWMANVNGRMIYDKTANDRQRKKQGLQRGCSVYKLNTFFILSSSNPDYMMKKAEWCYLHNLEEISR